MVKKCPFCNLFKTEVVIENDLCFAKWDKYQVTDGHMLIIPNRHVDNYFSLTHLEKLSVFKLLEDAKSLLDKKNNPDGYNIGVNVGEAAGQTIKHVHIHLIPRYIGDVEDPKGGVRGVIPVKQKY